MNRIIKFRGRWKRGNRQWYYGTSNLADVDYKKNIIPLSMFWLDVEKGLIDPATVGEWSGRTDCNGSDIYCGDILKDMSDTLWVLTWNNPASSFDLQTKKQPWRWCAPWTVHTDCTITGNIHDGVEVRR